VKHGLLLTETDTYRFRMLEDPSYDQVVRWSNEGDSFVVLEVGTRMNLPQRHGSLTAKIEREIHKVDFAKAF
jgi:hypothetical protein